MGAHEVEQHGGRDGAFLRAVLEDLEVLEELLLRGAFDDGPARLGAEQEYSFVDERLTPAPVVDEVLKSLDGRHFTTELGRFNLEANLTPLILRGGCFAALKAELATLSGRARTAAKASGADLIIAGILPTFDALYAGDDQLTPSPRFEALNRLSMESRGGRLPLYIQGADTLAVWHDNIVLEAGPTSFQVHLQVRPDAFVPAFNAALLLAAPLVAACANSSIVGGLRLWHETRIPLLERSADVRSAAQQRRGGRSRTSLGHGWLQESVLEVYRRDLQRFDPVVVPCQPESSRAALARGQAPSLKALMTFNGTIWRWIRPCYGITDGKPHLRIENRVLPAGPSLTDELANTIFWVGLMHELPRVCPDINARLAFSDANANLHEAARLGLAAELRWLDGRRISARALLLEALLPMAAVGLQRAGLRSADTDEALATMEARVRSGRTGAVWLLESFEALPSRWSRREKAWALSAAIKEHCWSTEPVHRWPLAAARPPQPSETPVAVAVTTDFISLAPEAPIELAEYLLSREQASHLVVEDGNGTFVGVVSAAQLATARARPDGGAGLTLAQIAHHAVQQVSSLAQPARELLQQMREGDEPCRIVLRGALLVGVVFPAELARVTGSNP